MDEVGREKYLYQSKKSSRRSKKEETYRITWPLIGYEEEVVIAAVADDNDGNDDEDDAAAAGVR